MATNRRILVISSYPAKGQTHGVQTVGVASYTKRLLIALRNLDPKLQIEVFAEKLGTDKRYDEHGIKVERVWQRGNLLSIIKMFWKVKFGPYRDILISHEAYMWGGLMGNLLMLGGAMMWRLRGKRVSVLLHQVPGDLRAMGKGRLTNYFNWLYLRLVEIVFNRIIVFEEELRTRFVLRGKIDFVPHLVGNIATHKTLKRAKKTLLYFGYIAPYKGVKRLIEAWDKNLDWELVIAGGINPNHLGNKKIENYVSEVEKMAKDKGARVTGFVPENRVGEYISQADLVILPYETFFSSSGPLSLAWQYSKPVLLSRELNLYAKSNDIFEAMKKSQVNEDDLFVDMNKKRIKKALDRYGENSSRLREFACMMAEYRSEDKVARQLLESLAI